MRTDCATVDFNLRIKNCLGQNTDISMPIPTSRNSVSLSPVGANFRDIDPTRHLDTISEAISTDDSQATQPTSRGFRDNALETDRGFRVGTESFANLNEIAVTPKSQKGVSSRVCLLYTSPSPRD